MIDVNDLVVLAYIDPGTGSMILQMIGAAIAAIYFSVSTVRTYFLDKYYKIINKLKKGKKVNIND
jgi:hypothetical protein